MQTLQRNYNRVEARSSVVIESNEHWLLELIRYNRDGTMNGTLWNDRGEMVADIGWGASEAKEFAKMSLIARMQNKSGTLKLHFLFWTGPDETMLNIRRRDGTLVAELEFNNIETQHLRSLFGRLS